MHPRKCQATQFLQKDVKILVLRGQLWDSDATIRKQPASNTLVQTKLQGLTRLFVAALNQWQTADMRKRVLIPGFLAQRSEAPRLQAGPARVLNDPVRRQSPVVTSPGQPGRKGLGPPQESVSPGSALCSARGLQH